MSDGSYVDQWQRKRDERIAEFARLGIKAEPGKNLGAIQFSAVNIKKILQLLNARRRKLKENDQ